MQKLFKITFYIELFPWLHFDLVPQPKFCGKVYFRVTILISFKYFYILNILFEFSFVFLNFKTKTSNIVRIKWNTSFFSEFLFLFQ